MSTCSQGVRDTNFIESGLEFTSLVHGLELTVSSDVLSANEDVGNGALVGHLLEGVLDSGSVLNLVKFNDGGFDVLGAQELLGLTSEGAGRFAVHEDLAVVNVALDGLFVRSEVSLNHDEKI